MQIQFGETQPLPEQSIQKYREWSLAAGSKGPRWRSPTTSC